MQWAFFALDLSLPLAATGEFVSRDRGPRRQQTDVKSSSATVAVATSPMIGGRSNGKRGAICCDRDAEDAEDADATSDDNCDTSAPLDNSNECDICCDTSAPLVRYQPCGHGSVCATCTTKVSTCPVCRSRIDTTTPEVFRPASLNHAARVSLAHAAIGDFRDHCVAAQQAAHSANIKPVVADDQLLFLYGNSARLMDKYGGGDRGSDRAHTWAYTVEQLGALSREPYTALRLPLDSGATYSLPIDANSTSTTIVSKRIAEAAAHCVPIWMTHKPNCVVPTFFTLRMAVVDDSIADGSAVANGDDDNSDDGVGVKFNMTMDNALSGRAIYPQRGGHAHEYISSHMHISTLILDCDLKLPAHDPRMIDEPQMYRDMVELVEQILDVIAPMLTGQLVHYLFKSTEDGAAPRGQSNTGIRKYGVHHHICLPPPFVMSSNAACELIDVLNSARYQYPNTIGIDCELNMTNGLRGELNDGVYDTAVYTRTLALHKSTARGHGLRGPYQRKADDSRPLVCVHRTDLSTALIPASRLYAHAAHHGTSPLVGSVIERFIGALPITDEAFLRQRESAAINSYTAHAYGVWTFAEIADFRALRRACRVFSNFDFDFDFDFDFYRFG